MQNGNAEEITFPLQSIRHRWYSFYLFINLILNPKSILIDHRDSIIQSKTVLSCHYKSQLARNSMYPCLRKARLNYPPEEAALSGDSTAKNFQNSGYRRKLSAYPFLTGHPLSLGAYYITSETLSNCFNIFAFHVSCRVFPGLSKQPGRFYPGFGAHC
jgi:hypothetical protein